MTGWFLEGATAKPGGFNAQWHGETNPDNAAFENCWNCTEARVKLMVYKVKSLIVQISFVNDSSR